MRFYIIGGLVGLVLLVLLLRWFLRAPPGQVARVMRRSLVIAVIGALVYLAASGRLHWLFVLVGALVPVLMRVLRIVQMLPAIQGLLNSIRSARGGFGGGPAGTAGGGTSRVNTRIFSMELDHDSGEMRGQILEGPFRDRSLATLDLPELRTLLQYCRREDAQSAAVLEAYLDRMHGTDWRDSDAEGGAERQASPNQGIMSEQEARDVLGVSPEATREQIVDAHRHLMQKLHPDRGGSDYLAAKINQAKEVLLKDTA